MTIKNCKTCANNIVECPPHTCDECTSLDAEEDYSMWTPKEESNGKFYIKIVYDLSGNENELYKMEVEDFILNMLNHFYKETKMK